MTKRFEPEDVRSDLLFLRKGIGFTKDRFARCKALVGVLGGPGEGYDMLRERLESAIWSLRDDDAELLITIYGLDDQAGETQLGQRRDALGATLGLKRDAIADRDTKAVENLLTQLITGWYPKSPTGLRVPESHNSVVQHAVHVRTVVSDGRHLETRHHYRLFTLFDEAPGFAIDSANPKVEVISTDFTVETEAIVGGFHHTFRHEQPKRRGETYDLVIRFPGDPSEEAWLIGEYNAFHEPTRFASFEVLFLGQQPVYAWRFSGLTHLEAPGEPSKERLLDLGLTTSATAEFRELYGGLFAGLAWRWRWERDADSSEST
ncbi:MAG: hypothetical protein NTX33_00070 [Propionibacteriales bacterium]|nr:hypothetical protein [Propionibacteriales bacterium]